MRGAYGLEKLGVENTGMFFTRSVLVDVAGYKNVDTGLTLAMSSL